MDARHGPSRRETTGLWGICLSADALCRHAIKTGRIRRRSVRLAKPGPLKYLRRRTGGRVVDGTALEMRRACKGSVGSNPTLSASKKGATTGPFFTGGDGGGFRTPVRQIGASRFGQAKPDPSAARTESRPRPDFRNPTLSASPFAGLFLLPYLKSQASAGR